MSDDLVEIDATLSIDNLPCPRLQLRWVRDKDSRDRSSWYGRTCIYSLVLPLQVGDIRSNKSKRNPREYVIEISRTRVVGGSHGPPIVDNKIMVPYRDGRHVLWDKAALGGHLPIVVICKPHIAIMRSHAQVGLKACAVCGGRRYVDELRSITGEPHSDRIVSVTCTACGGSGCNVSTEVLLEMVGFSRVVQIR